MTFLSLTKWNRYGPSTPCLVNLATVTWMEEQKIKIPTRPASAAYPEPLPAGEYKVTLICFAAGMHEETESIYVLESLDTILRNS